MPDTDAGDSAVWTQTLALLAKREQRKWDSFSWLALRPLISSLNDRLNGFAPTMVADLRNRWVAGQDADDLLIVDRSDCSSFIVLGDPGEQDASQYVVVPALREQAAGVDFMVICSDVIYPSGDVNDYVDGFYVPYAVLTDLPILALPGNHDWYEGLTGFMWHFCGALPLPDSAYGPTRDSPPRERPFRLLWRRPTKPQARLHLEQRRAARAPGGNWAPLQPGPYYAIETSDVLLVCIDTGIDRTIDRVQGEWLRRVSTHPKPKVLLTGAPLVVNRERHPCVIAGGPVRDPARSGAHFFHSVADIVAHPPHGYVACLGGDIHNFQHYRVDGFEHVVAGGGGAYMSATHPIPVALQVAGGPQPDVPPAKKSFPTEPQSLRHFARLLLPRVWRLVRVLIAVLAGVVAAVTAVTVAGEDSWPQRALRWAPCAVAGCLGLRLLVVRPAWTRTSGYRLFVVLSAFLAGLAITRTGAWLAPDHFRRQLLAWIGITACGGLLAWLLRLTGWWRPPLPQSYLVGRGPGSRWLPVLAVGFVLLPVAIWLVRRDWWLTAAAAVTAVAAVGGWLARWEGRPRRPRPAWKQLAPAIAYPVQLFDALVVLDRLAVRDVPQVAFGVTAGLVVLTLVAVAVVLVLSTLFPPVLARAALILPLVTGGLWVVWACCGGDSVTQRAALMTVVLVVVLVAAVFGIDALRRRLGRSYKIAAAVIVAALALGLVGAGVFDTWLPRAAALAGLLLVLSVSTVATENLTFLGAFSLVWDVHSHRLQQQLSEPEAEWVIRWRAGGHRPPWRHVRRRANIVFPAAGHPHGPIQSAVSEIFDSDEPPFIKNFLVVRSEPDALTVTAHVVTGTDDPPPPYEISIPLPG
ncbi:MAG: hypothetical protein DLM59_20590 [Pseudonocardiales bacterium]|nr:MAG: hypothetical protein DLM59_20590 [Pseudonocardiales bacterium]